MVVEIGAGQAILTVCNFSESLTRKNIATLIRINPVDYKVGLNAILVFKRGI